MLAFASARPACACTTKAQAYRNALKSDLRILGTVEEDYHGRSGHYTADLKNEADFAPSSGVTLTVEHADEHGWTARARHALWNGNCTATVGPEAPSGQEGVPICHGSVYASTSSAIQASVYLLVVVGALVFAGIAALRGRAPWWPLIPLGLLLGFHPSWSLLASAWRGQIPGSGDCGAQLHMTALLFALAGGALWWCQRRWMRSNPISLTSRPS